MYVVFEKIFLMSSISKLSHLSRLEKNIPKWFVHILSLIAISYCAFITS